jgi:hypothetical protein
MGWTMIMISVRVSVRVSVMEHNMINIINCAGFLTAMR